MTLTEIYEKVNLVAPLEQRLFFNYFEDSVNELRSIYHGYDKDYVLKEGIMEFTAPKVLSDDNNVRPMYYDAIVDNILFLAGAGEERKNEFLRKSRNAFMTYWTENAKGRRVKRMRW